MSTRLLILAMEGQKSFPGFQQKFSWLIRKTLAATAARSHSTLANKPSYIIRGEGQKFSACPNGIFLVTQNGSWTVAAAVTSQATPEHKASYVLLAVRDRSSSSWLIRKPLDGGSNCCKTQSTLASKASKIPGTITNTTASTVGLCQLRYGYCKTLD